MKERKMNEKVAQVLHKGKEIAICTWEIAKPVCIKGKALALQGYEKGNVLMDKVAFLQKPLHKKIVWGAIGLVFLWIVFPSGSNGGSGTKGNAREARIRKLRGDIEKNYQAKELWVEGTNVCKVTSHYHNAYKCKGDIVELTYRKVEPKLIPVPKIEFLCNEIIQPNLSIKKGRTYRGSGAGDMKVVHVGAGYVIATPDYRPSYCKHVCEAYIVTDDEYVDGEVLKEGLYDCIGRKEVPLANGSSTTMLAFKKRNDGKYEELAKAEEYNNKAQEAARKENDNRYRETSRKCDEKKDEARKASEKAAIDAVRAKLDPLFIAEAKKYMEPFPMKRLHIAPDMKTFIRKIAIVPCFSVGGDMLPINDIEAKGCLCYYKNEKHLTTVWSVDLQWQSKDAKSIIAEMFKGAGYRLDISWNEEMRNRPFYKVYVIRADGVNSNGKPRYKGDVLMDPRFEQSWALNVEKDRAIYVFDGDKNAQLREIWGNGESENAMKFARAFKKLYESDTKESAKTTAK